MKIRKHLKYFWNRKPIYEYSQEPRGDVKPLDREYQIERYTSFREEDSLENFSSSPLGIGTLVEEDIKRIFGEVKQ